MDWNTMKTAVILCSFISTVLSLPISLDTSCKQEMSNTGSSVVSCTFEFTNRGREGYCLLKRNTPLEGLASPFITVSHDGVPLEYQGIDFYRFPPERHDFVYLSMGESITATVHINDMFTFSSDGIYKIQYTHPLWYFPKNKMGSHIGEIKAIKSILSNEPIYINIKNLQQLSRPVKKELFKDEGVQLEVKGCGMVTLLKGSKKERNSVLTVQKRLCSQLKKTRSTISNSDLYRVWFGEYNEERSNKVREIFQNIIDGLSSHGITYDLNGDRCTPAVPAYTLTNVPSTVYLCPVFHQFVTTMDCTNIGISSKESIILHKLSQVFGSTQNYNVYGQDNNKELAVTSPEAAVTHSDSYECYYCHSYGHFDHMIYM
ncbi:PREDICTED: uncharacterized protein LOC100631869 [Amphimedon queenslandica]|uniref:Lysine-specific metallo-endopeptidase domain-containing protein n=1 Tax=Amphimedon queenslandica TaxID=400682 RepID=A0A1X7UR82_AMPQE|nr:PREDICTED: uncharacterized protein LOC100631869 [Amphimedon queenslandica]|eukprot:XP_003387075.1 PREDICTED: uncharacterized protein LOC100631869 [Amphimedon queenslandica]